jgi:PPIC-type PPIASE domain
VYFDPARRHARRDDYVGAALRALERDAELDPTALGDATLLPAVLRDVARVDVAAQLGDEVAAALTGASAGRWFGPVSSPYGEHLLRVDVLRESEAAVLADVREAVERDVRYARTQTAREALYERLRARYTVRIEQPAGELGAALAADSR